MELKLKLDCEEDHFTPYSPYPCTVSMENKGLKTVAFHKAATPWDDLGVRDDFFDTNPSTAEYLGVVVALNDNSATKN